MAILPAEDPLRLLHRFPVGERWSVTDDPAPTRHSVAAEATLASANDLEWDYWRQRNKAVPAARNYVSFAMSSDEKTRPRSIW